MIIGRYIIFLQKNNMEETIDISSKIKNFNRYELQLATELNQETSFFSEIKTDIKRHPYYIKFYQKIKKLYRNSYKEDAFVNLYMKKRTVTSQICNIVFNALYDIFDAQNKIITINIDNETESDVLKRINPYLDYFKTTGFENVKTGFNSFIIMDIDQETLQPILRNLLPEYVYYIDYDDDQTIDEIVFSYDDKIYFNYTERSYAAYMKISTDNFQLISERPHQLGVCPCLFFLYDRLNNESMLLRKNVLTPQLDDLFQFLIFETNMYILDLLCSNPLKAIPSKGCGYTENTLYTCRGGLLYYNDVDMIHSGQPKMIEDGTQELCPVCGHNRHIGSGDIIQVNYEKLSDAKINVKDLVTYFQPPLDSLEYHNTQLEKKKNEIIKNSVGLIDRDINMSRNKTDIQKDFETRTKILINFSANYSYTIQKAFELILKFWYGKKFNSVNVFLGNIFYLQTKDDLFHEKEITTNPIDRMDIAMKIINMEYKNDPNKKKEMILAYQLMPYSGISDVDFLELIKLNKISDEDIELRYNFNYYISEFERLNQNKIELVDINYIRNFINQLIQKKINNGKISNKQSAEQNTTT